MCVWSLTWIGDNRSSQYLEFFPPVWVTGVLARWKVGDHPLQVMLTCLSPNCVVHVEPFSIFLEQPSDRYSLEEAAQRHLCLGPTTKLNACEDKWINIINISSTYHQNIIKISSKYHPLQSKDHQISSKSNGEIFGSQGNLKISQLSQCGSSQADPPSAAPDTEAEGEGEAAAESTKPDAPLMPDEVGRDAWLKWWVKGQKTKKKKETIQGPVIFCKIWWIKMIIWQIRYQLFTTTIGCFKRSLTFGGNFCAGFVFDVPNCSTSSQVVVNVWFQKVNVILEYFRCVLIAAVQTLVPWTTRARSSGSWLWCVLVSWNINSCCWRSKILSWRRLRRAI